MIRTQVVRIEDRGVLDGAVAHKLYTTLEGENPGGSVKDRMVLGYLAEKLADHTLRVGDRVSEISAGSTARSLAVHGRKLGLEVVLFVPDYLSAEEIEFLRSTGSEVHLVSKVEG